MAAKKRDAKPGVGQEDDPVEWTDEMFDRAQISVGGVVIREATGTLTKSSFPKAEQKQSKKRGAGSSPA